MFVLIAPYRHPLLLANEAASLDVLSDGRFVLGVGAGWNEEEFSALGISARERGRRTDEALEAMRRLWAGGPATYEGRYYSFANARSVPDLKRRAGHRSWWAATATPP